LTYVFDQKHSPSLLCGPSAHEYLELPVNVTKNSVFSVNIQANITVLSRTQECR